MKQVNRAFLLIVGIFFAITFLLFTLGWTGYSKTLEPYAKSIQEQLTPHDQETLSLQKREMELISEIESNKILEVIKEQQKILEDKERELNEREDNINALVTTLEEEKNNFLRSQELLEQRNREKVNYQEKLNALADTFTSMPPERAVERILALNDDMLIIDVMNTIDRIAGEAGQISIAPLYYSLMEEKDASRILKKSTVTF